MIQNRSGPGNSRDLVADDLGCRHESALGDKGAFCVDSLVTHCCNLILEWLVRLNRVNNASESQVGGQCLNLDWPPLARLVWSSTETRILHCHVMRRSFQVAGSVYFTQNYDVCLPWHATFSQCTAFSSTSSYTGWSAKARSCRRSRYLTLQHISYSP